MGLSHNTTPLKKLGFNKRESDLKPAVRPEDPQVLSLLPSPERESHIRRIPEGQVFGQVQIEACKAYPIHLFDGLGIEPRIAYADRNTHHENNIVTVKLLPSGGKTAPHPQIVLFVNGPYHIETLGYQKSNPLTWTTWMEFHMDFRGLEQLIEALIRVELKMKDLIS